MTFDPQKPAAPDILSDSQADLLANNNDANTNYDIDHVALIANEDNGKHDKTTLKHQADTPIPETNTQRMVVFPELNGNSRVNVFCKYPTNDGIIKQIGIIPFAAHYFRLNNGGTVTTRGTAINLSSTWNNPGASNTISNTFTTAADNAFYFVRISVGNDTANGFNGSPPFVVNQTANGFDLLYNGTASFLQGNEFYVFVYEV